MLVLALKSLVLCYNSLTTFHETNCSWPERPKEFPDDEVLDSELR